MVIELNFDLNIIYLLVPALSKLSDNCQLKCPGLVYEETLEHSTWQTCLSTRIHKASTCYLQLQSTERYFSKSHLST